MKKILFLIVSAVIVFSLVACSEDSSSNNNSSTGSNNVTTGSVENQEENNEQLTFDLTAGEEGDYGKLVTFNAGTDLEETIIAYHIPAGTYTVKNNGEYMRQISVYSDETHTVDGWEEPAESYGTAMIDAGGTATISIEEGQYIELNGSDSTTYTFEKQ